MTEDQAGSQQLLRAGKLTEAVTAASQELAADPDSIDSLYVKAVAERYLKHHKDSLETLQRLQSSSPGYARAWQEEGHNHRDLGDLDAARRAYQRAVSTVAVTVRVRVQRDRHPSDGRVVVGKVTVSVLIVRHRTGDVLQLRVQVIVASRVRAR